MPKKKDPSITFLNRFGYNVVKLPRVGIEPMDVIGKDAATQWLGPLRSVWTSAAQEPTPSKPRPAAAVSGQKTDALELKIGLKVLENALSAFGASVPSVDLAFNRARKVEFVYTNVTSTTVPPFEAGNYLSSGKLNTNNPTVKRYFLDEDPQAFLIVDVLKSDSVSVIATDEKGVGVDVDVPAIQQMVGAKVGVKSGGASKSTVTFTGPDPVTFGFIVNEIDFDGNVWSLRGAEASGDLAFAAATENAPAPILLSTSCFVELG